MRNDEPQAAWQSDDYQTARDNFKRACRKAAVEVISYVNPSLGPDREELATDVAWFGPENAEKLLVLISGVHGVEGFSGSASQVGWIDEKRYNDLPDDTAVLMIHLINPWGAAYLRRYTEDNADLCRNFMDFSQPLPKNEKYAEKQKELLLGDLLGHDGENTGSYLAQLVADNTLEYVIDLFMKGQYQYPAGFNFGGQKPTWSNVTLRKILKKYNKFVKNVCVVDFHTGLGPWGYGELITMHLGEELERVRSWFGRWVFNPFADRKEDEDGYREVPGHPIVAYKDSFPDAEVTAVTLEFGTYSPDATLACMLREHLLVHQPEGRGEVLSQVKNELLEYHHPEDWEWRCSFWDRSLQIIRQAINGLNR